MKYVKKSDVKFKGVRPQNALHYEDYAVFVSVEEYEKFNQYPTKQQLNSKENEIYTEYIARAYLEDGVLKQVAEKEFAKIAKSEAEKYFYDIRNNARKQLAEKATQTDKAYFVLHDISYSDGAIATTCVAAFDNINSVKEFLLSHNAKDYVVDQDGKRIFGKTLEEMQNEQANQNDGLQA